MDRTFRSISLGYFFHRTETLFVNKNLWGTEDIPWRNFFGFSLLKKSISSRTYLSVRCFVDHTVFTGASRLFCTVCTPTSRIGNTVSRLPKLNTVHFLFTAAIDCFVLSAPPTSRIPQPGNTFSKTIQSTSDFRGWCQFAPLITDTIVQATNQAFDYDPVRCFSPVDRIRRTSSPAMRHVPCCETVTLAVRYILFVQGSKICSLDFAVTYQYSGSEGSRGQALMLACVEERWYITWSPFLLYLCGKVAWLLGSFITPKVTVLSFLCERTFSSKMWKLYIARSSAHQPGSPFT